MIGWLFFAGLSALALFVSAWWWIASVVVGLWQVQRWFFHNGRPWRRIHFPMMSAYAAVSGFEHVEAEKNGREFDIKRALHSLVKSVRPDWGFSQTQQFIEREFSRCNSFSDEPLIKQYIQHKNNDMPQESIEKILCIAKEAFNPSDKGFMVRMVIAGIIEDQHGTEQRGEYLFEVVRGKAV